MKLNTYLRNSNICQVFLSVFVDQQDRKTVTRSLSPVQRRSRGGYRGNRKGRSSGRGGFYGSEQTVQNYYMDFNGMKKSQMLNCLPTA